MLKAAQDYLVALNSGNVPSLAKLLELLDALTVAYHALPRCEPDETDADPPCEIDWQARMKEIGARFPDLGYYATVDPLEELPGTLMVGDAINDLVDIERDLKDFVWRYQHVSSANAHWHVRFNYEVHWGRHCRELCAYLHAKHFYGPDWQQ